MPHMPTPSKPATPKVSIRHMRWRDGKPRFDPGPEVRALNYKSRDLKHPDGRWFTFEETRAESRRLIAEMAGLKAAQAEGMKPAPKVPGGTLTLGQLCEDLFRRPEFLGKAITEGRRVRKPLAAKTVDSYKGCLSAVRKGCAAAQAAATAKAGRPMPSLWDMPADKLTVPLANALLHAIEVQGGLHVARAGRAFLSQMWHRCAVNLPGVNRHLWSETETMPVPKGRVRPYSREEFAHMLATADACGRPEIGDMMVWGVVHGQRQRDRLLQEFAAETATHFTLCQSKRGKEVTLMKTPLLMARFEAAKARRKQHAVHWPHLCIDEKAQRPWAKKGDYYRHVFAKVRDLAAITMPSCADLTDQDLRDTNQTWLDQALVDTSVMEGIAGHSPESAEALRKRHYVAHNQKRQDAAVMVIDALMTKPEGKKENEGC
jgi:hypothetical protein